MCKCYECAYIAMDRHGIFFCNFGDSDFYGNFVNEDDECDDGEPEYKDE